jgi:ATP-dependent Lhr-like helicase
VTDPRPLFDMERLEAGLDGWLAGNAVMKRTFRASAHIAGLLERQVGGTRKTGKQATMSSDILYDTLLKYDPDHLLMQITREEAMRGLVDFDRIREMKARVGDRIDLERLTRVTPLAAPLFLEPGRVPIRGSADERLLEEEVTRLLDESGLAQVDTAPKPRRPIPS